MKQPTILIALTLLLGLCATPMIAFADDHHHHHHGHEHHAKNDGHDDHPIVAPANNRSITTLLVVYCVLIVLASLAGGMLPSFIRLSHTGMQTLISGVGGLMLGIAVFHLLPHSLEYTGSTSMTTRWLMGGLLGMFFLVRAFHFHHHGPADQFDGETHSDHEHAHDCGHDHGPHVHHLNWIGVALGLALHTLIDGIALGASVRADAGETDFGPLLGLGTFLAILLHKPVDAISITSLMSAGGWSAGARNIVNVAFALMCPLGAALFLSGVEQVTTHQHAVIGAALAFAAGVFLCISLGDLLPELELHSHNRLRLSAALIVGVALAWAIEQTHSHDHGNVANVNEHGEKD